MSKFVYNRNLRDSAFESKTALPAAGATAYTKVFDFEQRQSGEIENIDASVKVPRLPDLVTGKKLTATLQDSEDGETFADTNPAIIATVVGGSDGATEEELRFRFPPATRRFVRLALAVETGGGTNTASVEFALLF